MEKLIDYYSVGLIIILLCNCLFIATADVGDRSKAECRKHGEKMVECQRKLHGVKTRVPADILEFPHMVMVGYKINGSDDVSYQCGGSLVSPLWVLSAAHCIGDSRTGPPVRVRLGTTTLEAEEQEEDLIQERNLVKLIVHPDYKPPAKYNDIALLKMDEPIDLDGDVRIACLQVEHHKQLFKAKASGFGKTKFDNTDGSQTMMHVDLDIIPEKQCNLSLRSMTRRGGVLRQGIIPSQICAGDLIKGGKDTCQGDSGGPLQFLPEDPDCINTFHLYVILGVTSFGRFCGFRNSPGVYTRVSYYVDWIENIVWPVEEQSTTDSSSTENNTEGSVVTTEIITENNKKEELNSENQESVVPSSTIKNPVIRERSGNINDSTVQSEDQKGKEASIEHQTTDKVIEETTTEITTETFTESSTGSDSGTTIVNTETTANNNNEITTSNNVEETTENAYAETNRTSETTELTKKSQKTKNAGKEYKTISDDILDDDDDFSIKDDNPKVIPANDPKKSSGFLGTLNDVISNVQKPISNAVRASKKPFGRSWIANWMVPVKKIPGTK